MKLRKDLGYDEINENLYGLYIMDDKGKIFCQVLGETLEDCDNKADLILELNIIL